MSVPDAKPTPLPGILGEIEAVVGRDAAWMILSHYGGTRVSFPAHPSDDHWLCRLIGRDAAVQLCAHFAVGSPDDNEAGLRHAVLPLGPTSLMQVARRRLAEELRSGKSVRAAAREVGLHERTAWRVKAELVDDEQGELF